MRCSSTVERCPVKARVGGPNPPVAALAGIAQLVEQWFCKPLVAGSIPATGSKSMCRFLATTTTITIIEEN